MPGILGGFLFAFKADTKGLNRGLDQSGKKIRNFRGNVRQLDTTLKNVGRSLVSFAGAYAGLAGIGAIARSVQEVAEFSAELVELGTRTGFTTDRLQTLGRVIEGEGGTFSGFTRGLERFSKSIGEAADGAAEYKDAFDQLGVSVVDNNGIIRSSEAVFDDVVRSLSGISSEAKRAQLVNDLFGRSMNQLITITAPGAESLDSLEESFRRLGIVEDDAAVRLKAYLQVLDDIDNRTKSIIANRAAANVGALVEIEQLKSEAEVGVSELVEFLVGRFEIMRELLHDFPAAVAEAISVGGFGFALTGGVGQVFGARAASRRADTQREQLRVFDQLQTNTMHVVEQTKAAVEEVDEATVNVSESWAEYWAEQVEEARMGRMKLGEELDKAAENLAENLQGYVSIVSGTRQQILSNLIQSGINRQGLGQDNLLLGLTPSPFAGGVPGTRPAATAEERAELKMIVSDLRHMRMELQGASIDLGFVGDAAADGLGVVDRQLESIILHTDNWGESLKKLALTAGFRFLSSLIQGGLGRLSARLSASPLPSLANVRGADNAQFLLPAIPSFPTAGGVQVTQNFQSAAPAVLDAVNQSLPKLVRAGADVQNAIARQNLARARISGSLD